MSSPPAGSYSSNIQSPFSQSWIQALTVVADNPLAKTIKPKLELINSLVLSRGQADLADAAKQLWALAESFGLSDLLGIVPSARSKWTFRSDDAFLYERVGDSTSVTLAQQSNGWSFDQWTQALGLVPTQVALTAEVNGGDWASLVRQEAVRLQKSFNMHAVEQANTLRLPSTAHWDTQAWTVSFDQVDWVKVGYDEVPSMTRPSSGELEELLIWFLASAGEPVVNKKAPKCDFQPQTPPWAGCIASLAGLHQILSRSTKDFAPWLVRVWHCVWPIVYREQQVLHERADVALVRCELKICFAAQPQLCLWMFVFAKLVCQTQVGTGLGFCADFRD